MAKVNGQTLTAIIGLLALVLLDACASKARGPISADAVSGYCPVCKMKVNAADQFACEIVYNDGTKLLFESQGDLLRFYFARDFPKPEQYEATPAQRERSNITKILAKDYNNKGQVDAREAALVYKSRVESLMGPDVFGFAKREDAEKFAATNGGKVVTFATLTPEMVLNLRER